MPLTGLLSSFRVSHTELIGYNDKSLITRPKPRSCQTGSRQQMHINIANATPHQSRLLDEKKHLA
jgi:hypothetical protein